MEAYESCRRFVVSSLGGCFVLYDTFGLEPTRMDLIVSTRRMDRVRRDLNRMGLMGKTDVLDQVLRSI